MDKNIELPENCETEEKNVAKALLKESRKLRKNNFAEYSAVITILFSASIWMFKSMWYAYMLGRFSVYNIDSCYINIRNDNIFLQIIQLVARLIIILLSNYIYYNISIIKDNTKHALKRKSKKILFWLVEISIVIICVTIENGITINELVKEITWGSVIQSLILTVVLCLMGNVYAIEILWLKRHEKKKDDVKNGCSKAIKKTSTKEKKIASFVTILVVTMAVEIIFMFLISVYTEKTRVNYKVIIERQMDSEDHITDIYYPVVYETSENYIVSRLIFRDGSTYIDYNYQKILKKEGQSTEYFRNVYKINLSGLANMD